MGLLSIGASLKKQMSDTTTLWLKPLNMAQTQISPEKPKHINANLIWMLHGQCNPSYESLLKVTVHCL